VRFCLFALMVGCGSNAGGVGPPPSDAGTTTPPPTVLATLGPAALNGSNLAIDSAFLYFTTSSGAMRVPLAGGTPVQVAAGMRGPLVLDAKNVYGFDATGIVSAPKSGGALTSVSKGSQLGQHLAVDATHLYFHDYYGVRVNGDNYHQSIFQLALATGTVLNIATNQFVTGPFASDDANLYFFSDNSPSGEVRLMSVSKSGGGTTTPWSTSNVGPDGPAFDGTNLYFTTSGGWTNPIPAAALRSLPATGGAPVLLASPDNPGDLAVDANNVYFTVHDDTIMKLAKHGGTPTALATQLNHPVALVLDAASVYWINSGDGTVVKTPL
jgi:hypothetical protein